MRQRPDCYLGRRDGSIDACRFCESSAARRGAGVASTVGGGVGAAVRGHHGGRGRAHHYVVACWEAA